MVTTALFRGYFSSGPDGNKLTSTPNSLVIDYRHDIFYR